VASKRRPYVERKIRRLSREISEIDDYFYNASVNDPDRTLHAGMLERKRDDVVRSAVLQLHTAIEDLLDSMIVCRMLSAKPQTRLRKMQTKRGKALDKMLSGGGSIGFSTKLNFATALGILRSPDVNRLTRLNTLRNKCSHNWLLSGAVRQGKRPAQKKPPLLYYEGGDLHKLVTLKTLVAEISGVYFRLFLRYLGHD
jgi:hypothetical protein